MKKKSPTALAKEIREKNKQVKSLTQEFLNLCKECSHGKVIITASKYSGTYSDDYDDSNPELRMCLICGNTETGNSDADFKRLKNPFIRLEFGDHFKNQLYINSPIKNHRDYSLQHLIKWCLENGYKV